MNSEYFDKSNTDEILCLKVAKGDREAEEILVLRYTRKVRALSRPFFLVGGDGEDLIQEGMLGLLSAIRDYDTSSEVPFSAFAHLCIRRRILTAIREASADKHRPLNNGISMHSLLSAYQSVSPLGSTKTEEDSPEEVLINKENVQQLQDQIRKSLSKLEVRVLNLYLQGLTYTEIAAEIQRPVKSVDNAVQRIRNKTARIYLSGGNSNS